jgi:hypothetical protein
MRVGIACCVVVLLSLAGGHQQVDENTLGPVMQQIGDSPRHALISVWGTYCGIVVWYLAPRQVRPTAAPIVSSRGNDAGGCGVEGLGHILSPAQTAVTVRASSTLTTPRATPTPVYAGPSVTTPFVPRLPQVHTYATLDAFVSDARANVKDYWLHQPFPTDRPYSPQR